MRTRDKFFARKQQSEFIQRVYRETPPVIQNFFHQENEMLCEALKGCGVILEVGCGFGRAAEFVGLEARYTGIDIGFTYVAEARQSCPSRDWVCADATNLPFADRTFDAVFCIQNTIGNMEGVEEKVMVESRRVVRDGGKLIVSAYSEDSFDLRRLWYDRLIDIGIFGRVWLDPNNARIARSDTGWSSRCFDRDELKRFAKAQAASLEITKLDSFLYFCIAQKQ